MKNSSNIILVFLIVAFLISFGVYAFTFSGPISTFTDNWIAFGNYFAGIAAILNVVVFVWLTITIQKANEKSHKADIAKQKEIILSKLRFDELTRLTKLFVEVTQIEPGIYSHGKISCVSFTINTFLQSRKVLFPILDDEEVKNKFVSLCEVLNKLAQILRDSAGLDNNGIPIGPANPLPRDFNVQLIKFQELRIRLMPILEDFILSSLKR